MGPVHGDYGAIRSVMSGKYDFYLPCTNLKILPTQTFMIYIDGLTDTSGLFAALFDGAILYPNAMFN